MVLPPIIGRIAHIALVIVLLVALLMLARVERPEPAIFTDLAVASTAELETKAQQGADRMQVLVARGVRDEQQLTQAALGADKVGCIDFYELRTPEDMESFKSENDRHRCLGKVSAAVAVISPQAVVDAKEAIEQLQGETASMVLLRGAVSHRYVIGLNEQLMPLDSAGGSAIVSAMTGELSSEDMQSVATAAVKRVDALIAKGQTDEKGVLAAAEQGENFGCTRYYNPQTPEETEILREDTSAHPCPGKLGLSVIILEPQALGEEDIELASTIEASEGGAAAFVIVHPIISLQPAAAISEFVQNA